MKTTKKESTKTFSEFPREIESIRNGSFFGINRGILPLQSFNHNTQSMNPFWGYQNPTSQWSATTPWSYGANQFSSPVFGVQPFTPSYYPATGSMNTMNSMTPFMPSPFTQTHNNANPAFYGAHEVSTTVNISEDDDSYTIEMTVPGYKNEDCKVKVKDSVLYVYGRREMETEAVFYSWKENRSTFFERTFLLSNEVETEGIEANCVDGILTLTLPKKSSDSLVEKEIEITEEELA
ncbi:MAG: Hsp20/alpha crystallin family protein [Bacteroidia bacterium]